MTQCGYDIRSAVECQDAAIELNVIPPLVTLTVTWGKQDEAACSWQCSDRYEWCKRYKWTAVTKLCELFDIAVIDVTILEDQLQPAGCFFVKDEMRLYYNKNGLSQHMEPFAKSLCRWRNVSGLLIDAD